MRIKPYWIHSYDQHLLSIHSVLGTVLGAGIQQWTSPSSLGLHSIRENGKWTTKQEIYHNKSYKANEAEQRDGEEVGYYLDKEVRKGLSEEVIFEQRPGRANQATIWKQRLKEPREEQTSWSREGNRSWWYLKASVEADFISSPGGGECGCRVLREGRAPGNEVRDRSKNNSMSSLTD